MLRVLERRYAASDADFEPPAGHVVEHADFDQRSGPERREVTSVRRIAPLGRGGQEQIGRRRHPERRGMMLGNVVPPDACLLVGLDQPQPLLE
jgi:hypothetical protein